MNLCNYISPFLLLVCVFIYCSLMVGVCVASPESGRAKVNAMSFLFLHNALHLCCLYESLQKLALFVELWFHWKVPTKAHSRKFHSSS